MDTSRVTPKMINGGMHSLNNTIHNNSLSLANDLPFTKPGIDRSSFEKQTSDTAKLMRYDLLKNSIDSMKSRRMYNFTTLDLFYNLCVCVKCKI